MYNPTVPKCCHEFGLLFCSVLLKLKPANKVGATTSRLNWIHPCYPKGAPFFCVANTWNGTTRKRRIGSPLPDLPHSAVWQSPQKLWQNFQRDATSFTKRSITSPPPPPPSDPDIVDSGNFPDFAPSFPSSCHLSPHPFLHGEKCALWQSEVSQRYSSVECSCMLTVTENLYLKNFCCD